MRSSIWRAVGPARAAHGRRDATRRWPALAASACCAALLTAGCAGPADSIASAVYDAKLPYVDRVEVSPKNPLQGKDYEDVFVYLAEDATDDQVAHLWCDVVLPARPDRLGQGRVRLEAGFTQHPDGSVSGGRDVDVPSCPAVPSASRG
jgi:hypothetical protein